MPALQAQVGIIRSAVLREVGVAFSKATEKLLIHRFTSPIVLCGIGNCAAWHLVLWDAYKTVF